MNERFKELRATAQELASQEHHTGRALDFKGMEQQCPDFQIFIARLHTSYEKFAELIVRECADILMKPEYAMNHPEELGDYNKGWVNGRLLGIEHIKKHFGVEE